MILRTVDIAKEYLISGKRRAVLNGVNLTINKGEIVSVTGKSGCGKTTLLNVISGITSPDTGGVFIEERPLRFFFDVLSSRTRNRNIGFIFQTFNLIEEESVLANVYLPARIRGRLNREIKDYIDDVLGRLRIYSMRKTRVGLLSGGQKQRVAIARALVNRPSLILADEPTANLDNKTSIDIFHILRDIGEEGAAVLIITHKDYMHSLSDRVYTMEDGILQRDR